MPITRKGNANSNAGKGSVIMITSTTSRNPEFLDPEGSEEEPEITREILLDLRKDVKVSKNTLEKLTLDINLMSKSSDAQMNRMDTREKKMDSSLSKQDAEIVHLGTTSFSKNVQTIVIMSFSLGSN
ncbi:unnamed protein product [Allacma fusca]|uniref:Uncharacterized protein n=1 Tax=Allacma fusca TaxID=39272 RepID=A0A8J2JBU5_9HEXA|nr:unnamed protein product [Allacma fusca]